MERFGRFQLLKRIGGGGMAEIFLAKPSDASMSKLVAVKRILPQFHDDPEFQAMFQQEGAIALRFRHHAIITVNELGIIDGRNYMSMEYFPAQTLAKIMTTLRDSKTQMSYEEKALIIKCIAEALQYIHDFTDYGERQEFIHRDISPHNIMVGYDGATKLIDFGIAKETSHEATQSRMLKGKVAYMSPEQIRGQALSCQTDIFSLGIAFWELLAEKKLFTGKTIKEVSDKVKACEIPQIRDFAPDVPSELELICRRALAEKVKFRYRSTGDLASDLDDYLRAYAPEGLQRNLARTIQDLFAEDINALKELLKTFEETPEPSFRVITASRAPRPQAPKAVLRRRKRPRKARDAFAVMAIALAGLALVLLYSPWRSLANLDLSVPVEYLRLEAATPAPMPVPMPRPEPALALAPASQPLPPPEVPQEPEVVNAQPPKPPPVAVAKPPTPPRRAPAKFAVKKVTKKKPVAKKRPTHRP